MFQMWRYSPHRGIPVSSKKYHCKACHKFGHFTSMWFQKSKLTSNPEYPKHISCRQVQFMQKEVPHMTPHMRTALVKIHFACKLRSNASRIKNKKFQDQHTWEPIWHTDWIPITLETFIWEPGLIPAQMWTWC